MNSSRSKRAKVLGVLVLGLCIAAAGWFGYQAAATSAAPSVSPAVSAQVLSVTCPDNFPDIGTGYAKVTDIDTFTALSSESLVEITVNTRLYAATMTGNAVRFEVRVDDAASPLGRSRALLRSIETGTGGVPVSMTAVFDNLDAGEHTLSLYAQATNFGTATDVGVDPGCFGADHAVVNEFLPFGSIAIPLVLSE